MVSETLGAEREPSSSGSRHRRSRSRSRSRSHASSRSSSRAQERLGLVYFALAAAWGFMIGTAAVVAGLAALGQPLRFEPRVGALLLMAAVLAVAGGVIAALAHRDASKRLR